jgi:hypothetical protein
MDTTLQSLEIEIETLKAKGLSTQALYHEVCALLFFRLGQTPTANRLYQLVKKGSMSAPAEALASFWAQLREKSRVRIEHPDLPPALAAKAGELVAQLWQDARQAAELNWLDAKFDAERAVRHHELQADQARMAAEERQRQVEQLEERLRQQEDASRQQAAALAEERGKVSALQQQIDLLQTQALQAQTHLQQARLDFQSEMERQRHREREQEAIWELERKRLLMDQDRERQHAARLQKDLDQQRTVLTQTQQQHDQAVRLMRQQHEDALQEWRQTAETERKRAWQAQETWRNEWQQWVRQSPVASHPPGPVTAKRRSRPCAPHGRRKTDATAR